MKKIYYFIIVAVLLILGIFIGISVYRMNHPYVIEDLPYSANVVIENIVEENLVEEKTEQEEEIAVISNDYVSELLRTSKYQDYITKNEWFPTEKYYITDLNLDDVLDCVAINSTNIYFYTLEDNNAKLIYTANVENEAIEFYEVFNKGNDEKSIIVLDIMADGLCYTNIIIKQFIYQDENIVEKVLGSYVCDQEIEQKLRTEIDLNDNLSDEEKDDLYIDAHTLKYKVGDQDVSADEFETFENNLKEKYQVLFKSNEYLDLFD